MIMDRQQYRNKEENPYEDYINKAKSLCEAYRNNSSYIKSVNFSKNNSNAKDISAKEKKNKSSGKLK